MKIQVHDMTGDDHTFHGSEEEIETHLRALFPGALKGVQKGDLRSCLHIVARLHGIQVRILEGEMPTAKSKKKQYRDPYEGKVSEYDRGVKAEWKDHEAELGTDPDETDDFD